MSSDFWFLSAFVSTDVRVKGLRIRFKHTMSVISVQRNTECARMLDNHEIIKLCDIHFVSIDLGRILCVIGDNVFASGRISTQFREHVFVV